MHPPSRRARLVAVLAVAAAACTGVGEAGRSAPAPSPAERATPVAEDGTTAPAAAAASPAPPPRGTASPRGDDTTTTPASPRTTPAPTPTATSTPTATPTVATPPPPPRTDLDDLVAALEEAVAAGPDQALAGVVVLDADGREVFASDGDLPLLPASTLKAATAAAVLDALGPRARLSTWVEAVGAVRDDGRLEGHLRVVGEGDPALAAPAYRQHVYASRPSTAVEDLATQVVAAGITSVRDGVRLAPDPFEGGALAPGWKPSYLTDLDARLVTGHTVDAGLRVTVRQEPPDLELQLLAAESPPRRLQLTVSRQLREAGVVLPEPDWEPAGTPGEVVAVVRGAPVTDLLRFALERSDNHLADSLLRQVGVADGASTFTASGQAARTRLAALGVPVEGLHLLDGSGLSRLDRATARSLATLDQRMRAGDLGVTWRDLGAEAGSEGTLRRRLAWSVASGRFVGKTGTLSDVVGIVGTVEDAQGDPAYHVAVLHNRLRGASGRNAARRVEDELVALLAEDAAGCVRVAPSPSPSATPTPDGAPPPPPVVRCPDAA